jgi:hypothetical protein
MKNFTILLLISLLVSCNSSIIDKKYTYIEIEKSTDSPYLEKEKEEPFTAESDSAAVLFSYKKYFIAQKANDITYARTHIKFKDVIGFKVHDEKGKDIRDIEFIKKDSLIADLQKSINSLNGGLATSYVPQQENSETPKIDNESFKKLKSLFNFKKDEFDPSGLTWVTPKSAPNYVNVNSIYCYFQENNGVASNLRLKFQYEAEDWLFIQKCQFLIDGKAYEFIPLNTQTDVGNGGICEWFDNSINYSDSELINALANAKEAKVKIIGRQYHKIKPITTKQIKSIKNTLDLYKAMGGTGI